MLLCKGYSLDPPLRKPNVKKTDQGWPIGPAKKTPHCAVNGAVQSAVNGVVNRAAVNDNVSNWGGVAFVRTVIYIAAQKRPCAWRAERREALTLLRL